MKRILYTLLLFITIFQYSNSQAIGEWEALLSYYNTIKVAETNNYVFAVAKGAQINAADTEAGGALFSYGKEDNSIKFYSRQDGLSDQEIKIIGYNTYVNTLFIVYANGNLDLFSDHTIYNIPYLKNSTNINNKIIYDLTFHNEFAYLSGEFGIMVVNMKKKEITDTYKVNRSVISTCIKNNYLYAVTNKGIIKGLISNNLLDINNWENHPLISIPDEDIKQIVSYQNYLCFNIKNKGIYYQKEDGTISPVLENKNINKIKIENNKLIAFTNNNAYIFSSLTQKDVVNTGGTINDISSLKDDTYWIAAGRESLKGIKKQNNQYGIIFSDTITANNCPKRNLCEFMTTDKGKLFVAGGGRWADRYNNYGTFMIYDNGAWINYDENKITQQAKCDYFRDITSIAIDPDPENSDHYFFSTWGEGIFEIKGNECINHYNNKNSILESAITGSPHYVRVEGLCFDKDKNLWMTNTAAENGYIKVLKSDGTWCSLAHTELKNANVIDKILIASNGLKWINILRTASGILILDDNGTIDDTSDDTFKYFTSLINLADKREITTRTFYCMTEDKEGSIYLGTGNGVMICPPTSNILQNEQLYANRIIRTNEDGTLSYFLDGERVNAIAVDGGNRKWIGTESSGVFLVNEDASETIYNFTTDNSPLLSNTIKSIAIDPASGKVYFGTDKGLIAYVGEATEGSESYSDVYAYPNPVRPDYNKVTITGLMENSIVKITDLNGNLIYQGKSLGGQLTWDCRNRSGRRVASGVYLVLAATEDSKESIVTKIAVIK